MATLKMGSTTVLTDTTLANAVQDNVTRLGTVTTGTLSSSMTFPAGPTGAGTGHILQVVTGELNGRVDFNSQSWNDIGLSCDITPIKNTSKIYITCSFGRATTTQTTGDHGAAFRMLRGPSGAVTGVADINGLQRGSNRPRAMFTTGGNAYNSSHAEGGWCTAGIDSPTIASTPVAITYKVQAWNQASSYHLIINSRETDPDDAYFYSSETKAIITLMEIG